MNETSIPPAQENTPTNTPKQSSAAEPDAEKIPPPKVVKRKQKFVKKRPRKVPSPTPSTTGGDEFGEEEGEEEENVEESCGESKDQKADEVDILCLEGTEVEPIPAAFTRKGKADVGTSKAPATKKAKMGRSCQRLLAIYQEDQSCTSKRFEPENPSGRAQGSESVVTAIVNRLDRIEAALQAYFLHVGFQYPTPPKV